MACIQLYYRDLQGSQNTFQHVLVSCCDCWDTVRQKDLRACRPGFQAQDLQRFQKEGALPGPQKDVKERPKSLKQLKMHSFRMLSGSGQALRSQADNCRPPVPETIVLNQPEPILL